MIVTKRTYVPRPGHASDLMELIREGHKILDYTPPFRILTAIAGPLMVVLHEIEYADLAEMQKFAADMEASDKWPGLMERWMKIVESSGSVEIWRIVE